MGNVAEPVKHLADMASLGLVLAALAKILPAIATILSILWLAARIYETFLSIRIKRKELGE